MRGTARPPASRAAPPLRRHRERTPPLLTRGDALFLDIDGTLLEFALDPAGVTSDPDLTALLGALSRALGGAVALVTGRGLADVDRMFAAGSLPVAALHGSARRAADGTLHTHAAPAHDDPELREALAALARRHPGLRFEDKGVAYALHYRAAPALASYAHRTMRRHAARPGLAPWFIQRGKGIVELRPRGHDKGTAIAAYMHEAPFAGRTPVFVGDDVTDEPGFGAVETFGGYGVKVGRGITRAARRLAGVTAVRQWLAQSVAQLQADATAP